MVDPALLKRVHAPSIYVPAVVASSPSVPVSAPAAHVSTPAVPMSAAAPAVTMSAPSAPVSAPPLVETLPLPPECHLGSRGPFGRFPALRATAAVFSPFSAVLF